MIRIIENYLPRYAHSFSDTHVFSDDSIYAQSGTSVRVVIGGEHAEKRGMKLPFSDEEYESFSYAIRGLLREPSLVAIIEWLETQL